MDTLIGAHLGKSRCSMVSDIDEHLASATTINNNSNNKNKETLMALSNEMFTEPYLNVQVY